MSIRTLPTVMSIRVKLAANRAGSSSEIANRKVKKPQTAKSTIHGDCKQTVLFELRDSKEPVLFLDNRSVKMSKQSAKFADDATDSGEIDILTAIELADSNLQSDVVVADYVELLNGLADDETRNQFLIADKAANPQNETERDMAVELFNAMNKQPEQPEQPAK